MEHLRPSTSQRPTVVLDPTVFVGRQAPLGRERVLFALPLDPGPALLSPPTVVRDNGPAYLADPQGALIGVAAVWVSRLLTVRMTEDTRRLG